MVPTRLRFLWLVIFALSTEFCGASNRGGRYSGRPALPANSQYHDPYAMQQQQMMMHSQQPQMVWGAMPDGSWGWVMPQQPYLMQSAYPVQQEAPIKPHKEMDYVAGVMDMSWVWAYRQRYIKGQDLCMVFERDDALVTITFKPHQYCASFATFKTLTLRGLSGKQEKIRLLITPCDYFSDATFKNTNNAVMNNTDQQFMIIRFPSVTEGQTVYYVPCAVYNHMLDHAPQVLLNNNVAGPYIFKQGTLVEVCPAAPAMSVMSPVLPTPVATPQPSGTVVLAAAPEATREEQEAFAQQIASLSKPVSTPVAPTPKELPPVAKAGPVVTMCDKEAFPALTETVQTTAPFVPQGAWGKPATIKSVEKDTSTVSPSADSVEVQDGIQSKPKVAIDRSQLITGRDQYQPKRKTAKEKREEEKARREAEKQAQEEAARNVREVIAWQPTAVTTTVPVEGDSVQTDNQLPVVPVSVTDVATLATMVAPCAAISPKKVSTLEMQQELEQLYSAHNYEEFLKRYGKYSKKGLPVSDDVAWLVVRARLVEGCLTANKRLWEQVAADQKASDEDKKFAYLLMSLRACKEDGKCSCLQNIVDAFEKEVQGFSCWELSVIDGAANYELVKVHTGVTSNGEGVKAFVNSDEFPEALKGRTNQIMDRIDRINEDRLAASVQQSRQLIAGAQASRAGIKECFQKLVIQGDAPETDISVDAALDALGLSYERLDKAFTLEECRSILAKGCTFGDLELNRALIACRIVTDSNNSSFFKHVKTIAQDPNETQGIVGLAEKLLLYITQVNKSVAIKPESINLTGVEGPLVAAATREKVIVGLTEDLTALMERYRAGTYPLDGVKSTFEDVVRDYLTRLADNTEAMRSMLANTSQVVAQVIPDTQDDARKSLDTVLADMGMGMQLEYDIAACGQDEEKLRCIITTRLAITQKSMEGPTKDYLLAWCDRLKAPLVTRIKWQKIFNDLSLSNTESLEMLLRQTMGEEKQFEVLLDYLLGRCEQDIVKARSIMVEVGHAIEKVFPDGKSKEYAMLRSIAFFKDIARAIYYSFQRNEHKQVTDGLIKYCQDHKEDSSIELLLHDFIVRYPERKIEFIQVLRQALAEVFPNKRSEPRKTLEWNCTVYEKLEDCVSSQCVAKQALAILTNGNKEGADQASVDQALRAIKVGIVDLVKTREKVPEKVFRKIVRKVIEDYPTEGGRAVIASTICMGIAEALPDKDHSARRRLEQVVDEVKQELNQQAALCIPVDECAGQTAEAAVQSVRSAFKTLISNPETTVNAMQRQVWRALKLCVHKYQEDEAFRIMREVIAEVIPDEQNERRRGFEQGLTVLA